MVKYTLFRRRKWLGWVSIKKTLSGSKSFCTFLVCQPLDRNDDPLSSPYKVAMAWYWMYLTRISTLLDTLILVGRKKFGKVTTFHVVVHCYSVLYFWIHARYAAGGHGTLDLITATSTLVEMHLHYLWISLGPSSHSWFKQHLTTFQVVQLLANLSRLVVVLILAPSCDFPWQISLLTFSFLTCCFVFFSCSYLELYVCPSKL